MRVRVDVIDEESARALRSARLDGLGARVVYHRHAHPELELEGDDAVVATWLRKSGYAEGEYEVVAEKKEADDAGNK